MRAFIYVMSIMLTVSVPISAYAAIACTPYFCVGKPKPTECITYDRGDGVWVTVCQ